METKNKNLTGLWIMAGLVVIGLMLPVAVSRLKSYDRVVSVKGLCERVVKADKVIWPMQYKLAGNDLSGLYSEMERANGVLSAFLVSGGLDESEIIFSLPEISDKYTQEYGNNDRAFRYVLTCTVTACTSKVDQVLALMEKQSGLISDGVILSSGWNCDPRFDFEGLNDIKPEMVEEATKNARAVAQKFATDSGSRLGKIKDASQGTFSIEDRDANTHFMKKVRIVTYVTYYLAN